jgi:hypothetical protein
MAPHRSESFRYMPERNRSSSTARLEARLCYARLLEDLQALNRHLEFLQRHRTPHCIEEARLPFKAEQLCDEPGIRCIYRQRLQALLGKLPGQRNGESAACGRAAGPDDENRTRAISPAPESGPRAVRPARRPERNI